MKHVIFFSGGIGSWYTTKRVIEEHGKENVKLLFTDTKIEDYDLYRFLDESAKKFDVELIKLVEGRSPWEVFNDVNFIGNSRIAHCSKILKQDIANKYVFENFDPKDTILYMGIDWTEEHRTKAPKENYRPFKVEFPMCNEPLLSKDDMLEELSKWDIEVPRLYKLGFSHNNCGGFCVRAGMGHFARLLKEMPDLYKHHEEEEQKLIKKIGKDVSILKRAKIVWKKNKYGSKYKDREVETLSLKQLRKELESGKTGRIDMNDIGGCGCFVTKEEEK